MCCGIFHSTVPYFFLVTPTPPPTKKIIPKPSSLNLIEKNEKFLLYSSDLLSISSASKTAKKLPSNQAALSSDKSNSKNIDVKYILKYAYVDLLDNLGSKSNLLYKPNIEIISKQPIWEINQNHISQNSIILAYYYVNLDDEISSYPSEIHKFEIYKNTPKTMYLGQCLSNLTVQEFYSLDGEGCLPKFQIVENCNGEEIDGKIMDKDNKEASQDSECNYPIFVLRNYPQNGYPAISWTPPLRVDKTPLSANLVDPSSPSSETADYTGFSSLPEVYKKPIITDFKIYKNLEIPERCNSERQNTKISIQGTSSASSTEGTNKIENSNFLIFKNFIYAEITFNLPNIGFYAYLLKNFQIDLSAKSTKTKKTLNFYKIKINNDKKMLPKLYIFNDEIININDQFSQSNIELWSKTDQKFKEKLVSDEDKMSFSRSSRSLEARIKLLLPANLLTNSFSTSSSFLDENISIVGKISLDSVFGSSVSSSGYASEIVGKKLNFHSCDDSFPKVSVEILEDSVGLTMFFKGM